MRIIDDFPQGTDQWLAARLGKITATGFTKVLSKGQGKTRKAYMYKLAAEIITGLREESFTNAAMEWGTEKEPQARSMYELTTGNEVREVSFVERNDHVGCSPDGLVGEYGLVEFKCPITTTQIEYYLAGKMPTTYIPQVQGQMWVCEREWCDFVSFDPRINGDASYFHIHVERDDEYIKNLEAEVYKFKGELDLLIDKLRG